ncbi:MAG: HAMP domain-containing histidine kinase [Methylococcales bacterium]|nr:HAMP domain-containing histidine kinase [Methylococcales bacterium]MBT7409584.1 HAMP domain-containing histidine kinase [Methylococcales bacterium]
MKNKQLIIFISIVLLPIILLSGIGSLYIKDQQEMTKHQITGLLEQKIDNVDRLITRLIKTYEQNYLTLDLSNNHWQMRQLINQRADIRQILIISKEQLFPPVNQPLSKEETDFLRRTARFQADIKSIIKPPTQLKKMRQKSVSTEKPSHTSSIELIPNKNQGWSVWYWENGINLIFWYRQKQGNLIAIELSRIKLVSDIIGILPQTGDSSSLINDSIHLTDSKNSTLYQWGHYLPPKNTKVVMDKTLSFPLNSWKINYYSRYNQTNQSHFLPIYFGFIACILLLIGLSSYFYRENNRDLKEAQQRVSFVNQVSHELKTPLTNIRMYAELIDEDVDEDIDPILKQRLGIITYEAQRLSRLINNILSFARKQRNKLRIHQSLIQIETVVQNVIDQFNLSLNNKHFKVELTHQSLVPVYADSDCIEQILGNLISNVEKYATSGKYLGIDIIQHKDNTTIAITDHGEGIHPKLQEKIFDPFFRTQNKLTDGVTGTGIGLNIAKNMAKLHGGDLTVNSSSSGSTFILTLQTPMDIKS